MQFIETKYAIGCIFLAKREKGFGFRVWGFGFRVSGLGFKVSFLDCAWLVILIFDLQIYGSQSTRFPVRIQSSWFDDRVKEPETLNPKPYTRNSPKVLLRPLNKRRPVRARGMTARMLAKRDLAIGQSSL